MNDRTRDTDSRSACPSTYREGSRTFRCMRADGHLEAGLPHYGWSVGVSRDWTDETVIRDPALYRCPRCGRVAPWTDGTVKSIGDEKDELSRSGSCHADGCLLGHRP